jgi:hypothetical protein
MKLQIYGSYDCEHCMMITTGLMAMNIAHEFLDANQPEHEKTLDDLNVDMLPFVQLVDDNGKVVWQKSGKVTLTEIVKFVKDFHSSV